jgi:hypothetical protein
MDEEKMREIYYKYLSDLSEIDEEKAACKDRKADIDTDWEISRSMCREENEMISEFVVKYGESEETLLLRKHMGIFYEQEEADFRKQKNILEDEYRTLLQREQSIEEEYRKWSLCEDTEDNNG